MLELNSEPSGTLRYILIYLLLAPWWLLKWSYLTWLVHPSCRRLSKYFYNAIFLVFSQFWLGVRSSYEFVHHRARHLKQFFLLANWRKPAKIDLKIEFFEFTEKFGYYIFLNLFYYKILHIVLCSDTNSLFAKNLVCDIWNKVLSVYQIPRILIQLYLQNKMM